MSSKTILRGSYREHPAGSVPSGSPAPPDIISITLVLRRRNSAPPMESLTTLSCRNFTELHGADPDDIVAVEEFVTAHGFSVIRVDEAARTITIRGVVSIV